MEGKPTRLEPMASPARPDPEAAEERRRQREEHRQRVQKLRDRLLGEQGKMSEKEAGMVAGRFSDLLDSLKGQVRRKDLAHRAWPQLSETSAASKLRGYLLPGRLKGSKRTERLRHLVRRVRLYVPLTDALAELTNKDEPGYYLPQLVAGTRYEGITSSVTGPEQFADSVAAGYIQEQIERYEPFVEMLRRIVEKLSAKYVLPRYFREISRHYGEGTYDGSLESIFWGPEEGNPAGRISLGPLADFLQPSGPLTGWQADEEAPSSNEGLLPNVPLYLAPIGDPLPVKVQLTHRAYADITTARKAPRPRRDAKIYEAKLYRDAEVRLAIAPRDDDGRCQPIFLVYSRDALITFKEVPPLGQFSHDGPGANEWGEALNAALASRYWTCGEYDRTESNLPVCRSVVLRQEEDFYRAVIHDPQTCEDLGKQPSIESPAGGKSGLWLRNAFYAVDGANCQRFLADIHCSLLLPIEILFDAEGFDYLPGSAFAIGTVGKALEDNLVSPRTASDEPPVTLPITDNVREDNSAQSEAPERRVSNLLEESVRERVKFVETRITEQRDNLAKAYEDALARICSTPQPKENQDDETHD